MKMLLDIQGQGPAALALRCMLMHEGWQGPIHGSQALAASSDTQRSLALSVGSLQLIRACTGSMPGGADIRRVEVQVGTRFARRIGQGLVMDQEDLGLERLGRVVSWSSLVNHLQAAYDLHCKGAALRLGDEASGLAQDLPVWSIKVCADGDPGETALEDDAGQSALAGRVDVRCSAPGWALERFLPDGPLALLPDIQAQAMQLVWCAEHSVTARRFAALRQNGSSQHGEYRLIRELNGSLPEGVEVLRFDNNMQNIRLKRRARPQILRIDAAQREASIWIGNAAQSLHPVAGQGLNLAFRDAAELARCLVDLEYQADAPQHASRLIDTLSGFEKQRQRDRWLLMRITDQLAKQSAGPWFQALAPQALMLARQRHLRQLMTRLFAFGPRDPWPIFG